MVQQPTSRLREWLSRQSQQQGDGTYLIRPFSPLPIIYQVDIETNRRWTAYRVAFGRFALLWIVAYFIVGQSWTLGRLVWLAVFLFVGYGWPLILVRGAHRVSRRRWIGPAVVDMAGRYSRMTWAIWLVVALLMTALLVYIGFSGRYGPVHADTVGLIVIMAAAAITFGVHLFRR